LIVRCANPLKASHDLIGDRQNRCPRTLSGARRKLIRNVDNFVRTVADRNRAGCSSDVDTNVMTQKVDSE
jgi:hypothetical protein